MSDCFLSIIIPAFNEERRLPDTLEKIHAYLARQSFTAEIIVVENGSIDRTADLAEQFAANHPQLSIRVLRENHRGKGRAVRRGMMSARGEYRFLCDADLSMPIEEIARFLPPVLGAYDVAIGSREALGSRRIGEPRIRHWMGRAFNRAVKFLLMVGFEDTQCGFKCFRDSVAQDLFSVQQLTGFGFDVEVLYVAVRRRYRVVEIPITWRFSSDSRVRMVSDSLRMFQDLLTVRRNWKKGRYHQGMGFTDESSTGTLEQTR